MYANLILLKNTIFRKKNENIFYPNTTTQNERSRLEYENKKKKNKNLYVGTTTNSSDRRKRIYYYFYVLVRVNPPSSYPIVVTHKTTSISHT